MSPDGPDARGAPGRVLVVGLGPAGADLVLPAARRALERAPVALTRTARHPAVGELRAEGLELTALDSAYDEGADLEQVYGAIARAVVAEAASAGEVAYAVPGNPAVAERTVELLRAAEARGEITLNLVPGLSFAELAWSRLGVDPATGARLVDGHRFTLGAAGAAGPMLVTQCDSRLVLGDVKLALLEVLPPAHPVTVLARLGLPGERVGAVALEDLDRGVVEPDHLTSLFVDTGDAAVTPETARLLELAERLRGPGGCPWDAEQDHRSLTRYLLEEAYEVVDAVEALPPGAGARPGPDAGPPAAADGGTDAGTAAYDALADELGDLLYQVVFHAVLAREAGAFTFADVARGIHDKLVRRHPHVFGGVEADTSGDVMRNWEQIKKEERASESVVDGIPAGLPALLEAHKLLRKAASIGLGTSAGVPPDRTAALDRLDAATAGLHAAAGAGPPGPKDGSGSPDAPPEGTAIGELLAATVAAARTLGVDGETSLHAWSARFRDRVRATELLAAEEGVDLHTATEATVADIWRRAG